MMNLCGMLSEDFRIKSKLHDWRKNTEKVLAPIDLKMEPIVEPPQEFRDWVWEYGMSFSRYGIYKGDLERKGRIRVYIL